MSTSTEPTTAIGFPEEWWDRFEDPPGWRAEIIGGELVMSPAPIVDHGRVQLVLAAMLEPFAPDGYWVTMAEWRLLKRGLVASAPAPDLIVARVTPSGAKFVTDPPLLIVEVLSPSDAEHRPDGLTRIQAKRHDYALNGAKDHLEIEFKPDGAIALHRYELGREVSQQLQSVTVGNKVAKADRPFPYEIDLGALARALHRGQIPK